MMTEIEDGLRGGDTLSDCFDRHPKIFPEFYRGILRSAELTGRLDTRAHAAGGVPRTGPGGRRKVKSATIYPAVIAVMSVVTVVVLAVFVLPRFEVFFASLDAELPLPTRMLLAVTDFLGDWWWALAGGFARLVLLVFVGYAGEGGRYARDRLLLMVPVLGETIRFALVERFCRILPSMVGAGVSLPEALRVATDSLRNRVFMRALAGVGEAMCGARAGAPAGRDRPVPDDRGPDDPGRRGDRHAGRPARGHRRSTTRASSSTRSRS